MVKRRRTMFNGSSYRFKLETALAAWRRTLEYNRAFTTDDLDELEQHLCNQVAALAAEGMDAETAYRSALGEMGDYVTAETEYRKAYWGKRRLLRHICLALPPG